MPRRRLCSSLLGAGVLIALLVWPAPVPPAAGELDEKAWKEAARQARKLMKKIAAWDEKILKTWDNKRSLARNALVQTQLGNSKREVIEALGKDDSRRSAELLVAWTLQSLKLQNGPIAKEIAATHKTYEKVDKRIRKQLKLGSDFPPRTWANKNDKAVWLKGKAPYDFAVENHHLEDLVRYALGEAFGKISNTDAVTYLIDEGLPDVQKTKNSDVVQVPIAKCLLAQEKPRALPIALRLAKDAKRARLRILALNWFGRNQEKRGLDAVVGAIAAKEPAVRRAAVIAAQALDDKRVVKPLIDSMANAEGQLRAEIEDVLHYFTGRSFEGSASVWKRWWADEGEKWLGAEDANRRHKTRREALPGGTRVKFYGIPTESHHVVFVLDRSGSMLKKAGTASIEKKKEKETGPTTGPKKGAGKGGKDPDTIKGDTRMEVAKNQLDHCLDELAKEVNFAVVFYNHDIDVWRAPPELMPSSAANKSDAKAWYRGLKADGPTNLFGALRKALEYSDVIDEGKKKPRTGADTVFLLTDGSPTRGGVLLSKEEIAREMAAFLEANKLYHCVVHTVGVGPETNIPLLQKIARQTGGTYKAIGNK